MTHQLAIVPVQPTEASLLLCAGGTFAASALLCWLAYWKSADWAQKQILESPGRRMRPLRWLMSVALVAIIAFFFDKIDVSATLEGKATARDLVFTCLSIIVVIIYGFGLAFLWRCESAIERDITALRRDLEVNKGTAAELTTDLSNERFLATMLSGITGERRGRLVELVAKEDSISIGDLKSAMDPDRQVSLAITGLYQMIRSRFRGGLEPEHQLRVAYFEPCDGYLACVASYDGLNANCIQNPNTNLRESFKLDPVRATKCLAVHCALNAPRDPIMIGDAEKASSDPAIPYEHLSETQKHHIKSVAGYSCRSAQSDQAPHAVITVDCSRIGFFGEQGTSRLALRRILEEFSLRLAFEREVRFVLSALTEPETANSDTLEISP